MPGQPRDPFDELGLTREAGADEVRAARRRLAKDHHPDAGGDASTMAALNAAAVRALASIDLADSTPSPPTDGAPSSPSSVRPDSTPGRPVTDDSMSSRIATDMPSFTVEALPVETFEALLVVASWIGEVLDDDPPYRLDVHLYEPAECWCRLELVPDAGSSTVSLTIGAIGDGRTPDVEHVRDTWIAHLNQIDWE